MNLSDNLKKIRKEHNLSQEDLAEKLGVSRQSVSKWESNQSYPEMDKMLQLCKMFDLNIDELLNQDIKSSKDNNLRKNKFNKQIESFLSFITKIVNMFSAMRFRDIIKCLFEQLILIIVGIIIYLILESMARYIFNAIYLPYQIITFLKSIIYISYVALFILILLHIFKIRYLDYYKIIDKNEFEKEEIDESKLFLKKEEKYIRKYEEKIIIRDAENSSSTFFSLLAKIVLIFFKIFVLCIEVFVIFSFICIVILMVLSFLISKTGLLFIGCLILGSGALILHTLLIIIMYNFIFNGKYRWNTYLIFFIISFILIGIGIGNILLGIKDFNVLSYDNEKYFVKETKVVEFKDKLDIAHYNIKYITTTSPNVTVEFLKPRYSNENLYYDNKNQIIYVNYSSNSFMEVMRFAIDALNDKYIINQTTKTIYVYANNENMNKINNK